MSERVTFLRVGVTVVLVGQGCLTHAGASIPAASAPDLVISPLDGAAQSRAPSAAEGVHFAHPLPVIGDAWAVSLEAASRSEEQVSTYQSEYRVEVLAVDGPAPSRVKLSFTRNVHAYQDHETPTAIHGKEYVVDARAPHVRDGSDGPAPEDEAQRVLDVFPDLGTRARIDEVLPDGAMRIGDRRDELAAAVLRVMHPRAWTLRTGAATLARVEEDVAVFVLSLDAESESGLRMQLTGESRVRLADARLADLSLAGTYAVAKAGAQVTGTFTLRRRVTAAPGSGRTAP